MCPLLVIFPLFWNFCKVRVAAMIPLLHPFGVHVWLNEPVPRYYLHLVRVSPDFTQYVLRDVSLLLKVNPYFST